MATRSCSTPAAAQWPCEWASSSRRPWRDGTMHLDLSLLQFMQRLATLVLSPGVVHDPLWCPHNFVARSERTPRLANKVCWRPSATSAALRVGGTARGTARVRAGSLESKARRMRGELHASPPAAAGLGQTAQAGVPPRPLALPELQRRAEDHCGDPETAGDWEDADAPGAVGLRAAALSCPQTSAARGLTIPIHRCSGPPPRTVAGVGCAGGFAGPLDAARWQGFYPSMTPERTLLGAGSAPNRCWRTASRPARSAGVVDLRLGAVRPDARGGRRAEQGLGPAREAAQPAGAVQSRAGDLTGFDEPVTCRRRMAPQFERDRASGVHMPIGRKLTTAGSLARTGK